MLKKSRNLLVAIIILPALIALIIPGEAGAANHAPVAKNQRVTTKEDTAKAITLVATDVDGDKLTYKIVAQPAHGTLSGTPPKVTYTPKANYNGSDSFTFKANDGKVDSTIAKVSITVTPVNDAPVAKNQSVTTNEDTAKAITLVATDADGDSLTYTVVSGPSHGTLTGSGANRTYTPAAHYYGSDSFTFKANDGKVDSTIAKVSITVTPVNDAPVAQNQSVTTNEDTAKAITLAATDVDGDSLTYTVVSGPSHGTLTGSGANRTYTPAAHYYGSDSFTFKANDGKVDSNIATVSITVIHVNHPPVAQNQSVTTNEDTAKAITLVATDVDGDPLTYTIVSGPSHGTLTGSGANRTYTPAAHYYGSDSFTFKANDGKVDSNIATVSITVIHVNHPPVAQDQILTTDEDVVKVITLSAADADGDNLTYQIVTPPTHGSLSGMPPKVTYTPKANYNGSDSFTFKANDGKVDSNTATVSITVIPVNDAPVAQDQSVTTDEDTAKVITLSATDVDGDSLTYQIVAQPAHGTLSGTPPNVTYTPVANYNGPDIFMFKANDGALVSNVATISITVTTVNDAPVAQDQNVITDEGKAKAITLVATDVDGDLLTYKIDSGPLHGTLTGTGANWTYTPYANYHGPDSFIFKANDGKSDSNVATVSITVTPVNDAPVGENQNVTVDEDTSKDILLSGRDGDGDPLTYIIVSLPSHGTLTGAGAIWTYTPNPNYQGSDAFTFKANDGQIDSNIATVSIMVTAVNDAPIAQGQSIIIDKDTAKEITLVATDADGDKLTYRIVTQPQHGTLNETLPNVIYAPNPNYQGSDSFTFSAYDGLAYSNVATVFLTVVPSNIITTVAGNGWWSYGGDGGPATKGRLMGPSAVAVDASGNLYIADNGNHRIRKVDANGIITTVAGNGENGFRGDGGPATQAKLNNPSGVAMDASGNLYIADTDNIRVRKVDRNGIITTVAGNGDWGQGEDGTPATQAGIFPPPAVAVDGLGNLYIVQDWNHRIRKVNANGIITTVAGNLTSGNGGYGGDGGPATQATLNNPSDVAIDASGNLYIADTSNNRIRKVDKHGIITTVAGDGTKGYNGDGGPAIQTQLNYPSAVAVDATGNLYIADTRNYRVRKVDTNGIITTVAGNGMWGYGGDGGSATQATLNGPSGVTVDPSGSFYIADTSNNRVRKVDTNGIITTVAGNDEQGDGGLATDANLGYPSGVAVDGWGNLYIADEYSHRIRYVDTKGIINTVAGNGKEGYSGDGGPAIEAQIYYPSAVAADAPGNLYIADTSNNRVRKVDTNGIITTVAGNGLWGYGGDGGPAIQATLNNLSGVAIDAAGNLYIADTSNNRIRKVDKHGIITTVAGNGTSGYSGDGGPATQAQISWPSGVAVDGFGDLYIADSRNNRIRKVDANGIITTVAGNGEEGWGGNGGPATQAQLNTPCGMAIDILGNLYIADYYNYLVRKVDTKGIITTVAGGGNPPDDLGDGGPATEARLDSPLDVAADVFGNLYIADWGHDRIRMVKGVFIPLKATITGKVTDSSTGLPLSDVTVTIKDPLNTFTTKTDLDGNYIVRDLIQGNSIATFEKSGYLKQTVTGTSIAGQTQTLNIQLTSIPTLTLTITSPQDGAMLNESPMLVTGNVSNNANVTVNGIQAAVNNNTFSASIPLIGGQNTITASATDQYDQTASHTINVTLIPKGVISGTVTDASTGLPLSSSTISITDSLGTTKTALTDNNGQYTITDITLGNFNGSITKAGYKEYKFSGTMSPGETIAINAALTAVPPAISSIAVSGITKNSATITWTTDQPTDSYVEYGTTTSYGNWVKDSILTTSHTILLTDLLPATLYHFRVTSANEYGFSSTSADYTFKTVTPPIILIITYPANGGTINRRDVMVKGIVINNMGNETGVTVNGIVAMIYGNEFAVNHVPLTEGSNTITATATDVAGNTEAVSIAVISAPTEHYINITATTESGLSPLETTLTIESSLDLTKASLTYTGPAEVEFLSMTPSEYKIRIITEGIYFFYVSINDSNGTPYQDAIAITVLSEAELDTLLRGKWESMRNRLASGDIEGALVFFDESTKQDYRDLFNVLSTMLPTVAQDMVDIQLIKYKVDTAIFDIRTIKDGVENSFQLLFTKDSAGIWKINSF